MSLFLCLLNLVCAALVIHAGDRPWLVIAHGFAAGACFTWAAIDFFARAQ